MTSRDELIEAAADAIRWASEHGGWADMARAALAALERAHAPIADEREWLISLLLRSREWNVADRADAILAAGFRRTAQGETSDDEREICDRCGWATSGHLRSQYGLDCPPGGARPGFRRAVQSEPTARHTFDSDDCVTRECDCANRQGEPTDAQLSEIEQRVYDEHRGMVAGFAKALIRAGWAAAVREGGRP